MQETIEAKSKKRWTAEKFVKTFVKGELTKKRKEGNFHSSQGHTKLEYTAHGTDGGTETLAVRVNGDTVFSNANRLEFCGTGMAWGRRTSNWGQATAQRWMEEAGAIPVPFSVFTTLKKDIMMARIIEKAPAEKVKLKVPDYQYNQETQKNGGFREMHYVGACLLELDGDHFLFDIDRGELEHNIFNPFVVKLAQGASSIERAYESLVPEKVKQARLNGITVKRQGEWFFIKRWDDLPPMSKPSKAEIVIAKNAPHVLEFGGIPEDHYTAGDTTYCHFPKGSGDGSQRYQDAVDEWTKANAVIIGQFPQSGSLKNGDARPNTVEKFVELKGVIFVSGKISHSGREHHDLTLRGWWEAQPNTAVGAWQVSGDID